VPLTLTPRLHREETLDMGRLRQAKAKKKPLRPAAPAASASALPAADPSPEVQRLRAALEIAWKSAEPAWIALADEYFQLGALLPPAAASPPAGETAGLLRALELTRKRLARKLHDGGVACLAPVGQVYTPELSDFLENLSQVPCPGATEPLVHEVVEPAVLQRGRLLRPGQAIIGLPAPGELPAETAPKEETA
jgi:hypothetical protein